MVTKRRPLTTTLPLCSICKDKHQDSLTFRSLFPTCDAFPDGIPEAVRKNRIDHRKPFAGDNGIRFELAEDSEASRQLLDSFDSLFENKDKLNRKNIELTSFILAGENSPFNKVPASKRKKNLNKHCDSLHLRAFKPGPSFLRYPVALLRTKFILAILRYTLS